MMKKRLMCLLLLCVALTTAAQNSDSLACSNKVKGILNLDFVSQYIWRGQDCAHTSLQPTLGLSWKGLSFTAWGSVGIVKSDDVKEIDLTLAYKHKGFNVGIIDYWTDEKGYFKYKAHDTSHVLEANVGYDFGFLSVQWYTNFLGKDYRQNGKRAYSSYLELAAPFRFVTCDWTAAVGISPYASATYGNGSFACVNVMLGARRNIVNTKHLEIPLFANLHVNPNAGKVYFTAGFALTPKL